VMFIGKLDIFPLISRSDVVHINELALILKIMCQCDVKCIKTLQLKTISSVLKVFTYIITSITGRPMELAVIQAIISV
jgi:hypothetical protein